MGLEVSTGEENEDSIFFFPKAKNKVTRVDTNLPGLKQIDLC